MGNKEIEQIERLLEQTGKLSFPPFASEKKKREILNTIRNETDYKISKILGENSLFESRKDMLWMQAEELASKEFDTLPDKLKMNSFYLQEVMHQYVEFVKKTFMNN